MIKLIGEMINLEKITSRDNQYLSDVRKVRDGKDASRIFIEGRRLVDEALRSGILIEECYCTEDFRDEELLSIVRANGVKMAEMTEKIFGSIADTHNSQGIILIAERPRCERDVIEQFLHTRTSPLPIVIFLKEINNPSNLGAILRTAEAAGVAGIIISESSADVYSPRSLRAAMGSSFRLPVWNEASFHDVLIWAKKWGFVTTAADIRADETHTEIDWRQPRLLIFGSEAHGLSVADLEGVDERMRIRMENDVESLNLAVSAGVILFEAKRQFNGQ